MDNFCSFPSIDDFAMQYLYHWRGVVKSMYNGAGCADLYLQISQRKCCGYILVSFPNCCIYFLLFPSFLEELWVSPCTLVCYIACYQASCLVCWTHTTLTTLRPDVAMHHVLCLLLQDVANFDDPQTSVPLLSVDNLDTDCDALILSLNDELCKNARLVGGKGSQLAVLHQANIHGVCKDAINHHFSVIFSSTRELVFSDIVDL